MFPLLKTAPPRSTGFVVDEVLSTDFWPHGEEVVRARGTLHIESRIPGFGPYEVPDYVLEFEVVHPDSLDDMVEGHVITFIPEEEL